MLVSCRWCGRTHPYGSECPSKPKRKIKSRGYSSDMANRFHDSAEWSKARGAVIDRDYHLCRVCHAAGRYIDLTRGRAKRIEVHHITKLVDDFSLRSDESNLISLCVEHHRMADAGKIPSDYLRKLANSPIEWGAK